MTRASKQKKIHWIHWKLKPRRDLSFCKKLAALISVFFTIRHFHDFSRFWNSCTSRSKRQDSNAQPYRCRPGWSPASLNARSPTCPRCPIICCSVSTCHCNSSTGPSQIQSCQQEPSVCSYCCDPQRRHNKPHFWMVIFRFSDTFCGWAIQLGPPLPGRRRQELRNKWRQIANMTAGWMKKALCFWLTPFLAKPN